jgi:hypothetical protein
VNSPDPSKVGCDSPDPLGAGHALLDPKEGSPVLPDPKGTRPPSGGGANPTEAHASLTTIDIKARDQSQTSDTR